MSVKFDATYVARLERANEALKTANGRLLYSVTANVDALDSYIHAYEWLHEAHPEIARKFAERYEAHNRPASALVS